MSDFINTFKGWFLLITIGIILDLWILDTLEKRKKGDEKGSRREEIKEGNK